MAPRRKPSPKDGPACELFERAPPGAAARAAGFASAPRKAADWLCLHHGADVTSQGGEDGIVAAALEVLGRARGDRARPVRWVVEARARRRRRRRAPERARL